MAKDGLGDRCKGYELAEANRRAIRGLPLLARLDGRAFHTFTRDLKRPYEHGMSVAMIETTRYLVQEMMALVGRRLGRPRTAERSFAVRLRVRCTVVSNNKAASVCAWLHVQLRTRLVKVQRLSI